MIKCSKAFGEIIERRKRYFTPSEMETVNITHGKLATYEDAEEQGRLVILPCKVGDKFYRAIKETRGRPDRINEYVCIGFYYVNFDKQGLQIRAYETSDGISHDLKLDVLVSASQFGQDIFLTWEEAKSALKGEKNK